MHAKAVQLKSARSLSVRTAPKLAPTRSVSVLKTSQNVRSEIKTSASIPRPRTELKKPQTFSIQGLSSVRRFTTNAESVSDLGVGGGKDPKVMQFTKHLTNLFNENKLDEAIQLYNNEVQGKVNADLFLLETMCKIYSRQGDTDKTIGMFKDIGSKGFTHSRVSWNAVIAALARSGRVQELHETLKDLQAKGIRPTEFMLNNVTALIRKSGSSDELQQCLAIVSENVESARREPGSARPQRGQQRPQGGNFRTRAEGQAAPNENLMTDISDVTANNRQIGEFLRSGQTRDAEKLFRTMQNNNSLNISTYNMMIKTYARNSPPKLKKMHDLLADMQTRNIQPGFGVYKEMIAAYSIVGNAKEVVSWYNQMKQAGLTPNYPIHSFVISAAAKAGDIDLMMQEVDALEKAGHKVDSNILTYIIRGYAHTGNIEQMTKWWSKLKETGETVKLFGYAAMILGYGRAGMMKEALEWLDQLKTDGLAPNVTILNNILDSYATQGNIAEMLKFFEGFSNYGISADASTYSTIIKGYKLKGDVPAINEWFGKMQQANIHPDGRLFFSLIKYFGEQGRTEDMWMYYDKMTAARHRPTANLFGVMHTILESKGDKEGLEKLKEVSQAAGFQASAEE